MPTREELLQWTQREYPDLTPEEQLALVEFIVIQAPQLLSISVVAIAPEVDHDEAL